MTIGFGGRGDEMEGIRVGNMSVNSKENRVEEASVT